MGCGATVFGSGSARLAGALRVPHVRNRRVNRGHFQSRHFDSDTVRERCARKDRCGCRRPCRRCCGRSLSGPGFGWSELERCIGVSLRRLRSGRDAHIRSPRGMQTRLWVDISYVRVRIQHWRLPPRTTTGRPTPFASGLIPERSAMPWCLSALARWERSALERSGGQLASSGGSRLLRGRCWASRSGQWGGYHRGACKRRDGWPVCRRLRSRWPSSPQPPAVLGLGSLLLLREVFPQ